MNANWGQMKGPTSPHCRRCRESDALCQPKLSAGTRGWGSVGPSGPGAGSPGLAVPGELSLTLKPCPSGQMWTHQIRKQYPEYVRNSYDSVVKRQPNFKKELIRPFSEGDTQVANKPMKTRLRILSHQDMDIKPTMRHHCMRMRMGILKKTENNKLRARIWRHWNLHAPLAGT